MNVTTIGIDLAKTVFSIHGTNQHGKVVVRKRLNRPKLLAFFAQLPPCLIGMEACPGAHWRADNRAPTTGKTRLPAESCNGKR